MDDTGVLFIQAYNSFLEIGDEVSLEGILYFWNRVPTLMNVTNIVIETTLQPIPEASILSVTEISEAMLEKEIFSSRVKASGLVMYENDHYYLLDPLTGTKLLISDRFLTAVELDSLANQFVNMTLLYHAFYYGWNFGVVDYEIVTLSNSEKALFYKDWLTTQITKNYYSGDIFEFPSSDPFGLGTSSYVSNANIDDVTHAFITVENPLTVNLDVIITINSTDFNYTIPLALKPYLVTSIADFINNAPDTVHILEGIIVATIEEHYTFLLKDETGVIYFNYNEDLQEGQEIKIEVIRNDLTEFIEIYVINIVSLEVLSDENALNYPPTPLTDVELQALDITDPFTYGQYIEIQGFLTFEFEMYHDFFMLSDGTNSIILYPCNYAAYETLFDWIDIEVIIRGYIYQDFDGALALAFVGIREDIKIPTYTDQETVDAIIASFTRTYAGKDFEVFEEFLLYPFHPLLGGEITWEFLNGSDAYYDFSSDSYIFTETNQAISIEITITMNTISETYLYNTTLLAPTFYTIDQLPLLDNEQEVYVKGTIIYRTPYISYLQDETGTVKLEVDIIEAFEGDYVIVRCNVIHEMNDSNFGETYLYHYYDYGYNPIVKTISQFNPIVIDVEPWTISDFSEDNIGNPLLSHGYVSLTGRLTGDTTGYDYFYLSSGDSIVAFWPMDEYTYYKVAKMLDEAGGSLFVTISGFIGGYSYYDNTWVINYTGLNEDIVMTTFTDLEKAMMVEDFIRSTYETTYIGLDEMIYLPATEIQFNSSITYLVTGPNASLINLSTHVITEVLVSTDVTIEATVMIGEVTHVFTFIVTILPVPPTDPEFVITDISDVYLLLENEIASIQGIVKSIGDTSNGYVMLVEDMTGLIFVKVDYSTYFYNISMIGKTITATGTFRMFEGRPEFIANNYSLSTTTSTVSETLEAYTLSELQGFDMYDLTNYGLFIEITGTIVNLNYESGYLLTDGDNYIYLSAIYPSSTTLNMFLGQEVTINGYFLGNNIDKSKDHLAILYTGYNYGYSDNIGLAEATDQELAQIVVNDIINSVNDYYHLPYSIEYLMTYSDILPEAIISYSLLGVYDYAYISSNYLYFQMPPEDTSVTVHVTVEYHTGIAEGNFEVYVKGYTPNSIYELFDAFEGTFDFALFGTVIYYDWGYTYFLIDGQIYYLEKYIDSYFDIGEEVVITGLKTIVDGEPNLTFDIKVLSYSWTEFTLYPISMTLEDIYNPDPMAPNFELEFLTIYGKLYYDRYLDMYYMVDGDYKVYIRDQMPDDSEYFKLEGMYMMNRQEFNQYIGENIYMNVLFPDKMVLNEYYMVDFRGYPDDIMIDYADPLTSLQNAIYRLSLRLEGLELSPADYLWDILPDSDYIWEYGIDITYSILEPEYQDYINFDDFFAVMMFDTPTTLTLRATLSRDNESMDGIISLDYDVSVSMAPREVLSLKEFLYAPEYYPYIIEGYVEYAFYDHNSWLIIGDGENRVYAECRDCAENGLIYQVGDYVRLLGFKDTYEWEDYVPIFDEVLDIEVISSGHTITRTPIPMTIEDILALNHLSPSSFGYYIEITGTIVFSGNSTYPCYDIQQANFNEDYALELRIDNEDSVYDSMFEPLLDQEVTIRGYLVGYEYIYDQFDWNLIVVEVITTP